MGTIEAPALKPHVLVVDDDDRLRDLLRRYLCEQGLIVVTAASAAEARGCLAAFSFDLMVLDVMMPGETGLALVASLRREGGAGGRDLPVLMLTARAEAADRIEGFESGADDYLVKPFEPKELLLRIQSILRRRPKVVLVETAMRLGRWTFEAERGALVSGEETQRLTDAEAGLLRILAAEPGVPLSREFLAERSRGMVNDRTVDVQVTRLRRKIEDDPRNPRFLVTVRGEGYMLLPELEGGA